MFHLLQTFANLPFRRCIPRSPQGGLREIGEGAKKRRALEGIRVLDLSRVLAGPFMSHLLRSC